MGVAKVLNDLKDIVLLQHQNIGILIFGEGVDLNDGRLLSFEGFLPPV